MCVCLSLSVFVSLSPTVRGMTSLYITYSLSLQLSYLGIIFNSFVSCVVLVTLALSSFSCSCP